MIVFDQGHELALGCGQLKPRWASSKFVTSGPAGRFAFYQHIDCVSAQGWFHSLQEELQSLCFSSKPQEK